jgi:hypothetical protein
MQKPKSHTTMTLGEMLIHRNQVIQRNALSILKTLEREAMGLVPRPITMNSNGPITGQVVQQRGFCIGCDELLVNCSCIE